MMKALSFPGRPLAVTCLVVSMFAAEAHARGPGYMFCEAEYRNLSGDGAKGYVSTVFHVSSFYEDDVSESFEKFIEAEYSPEYAPYRYTCEYNLFDSKREARDARNEVLSDWRNSGYRAHSVRWRY